MQRRKLIHDNHYFDSDGKSRNYDDKLLIIASFLNNITQPFLYLCSHKNFGSILRILKWNGPNLLKFGYSEKATKLEKIFHLKFDATQ